MYDFITIDFEIANKNMDSACSIGITAVKDCEIIKKEYFLINPPTPEFDIKNTNIHGITYDMVKNECSFADIWNNIKDYFEHSYFIVAHNAQFDMSVLRCCLDRYSIPLPDFDYIDSINIIRRESDSSLSSYNLESSAAYFSVDIGTHHNALDDSTTVANILIQILKNHDIVHFQDLCKHYQQYIHPFSKLNVNRTFYTKFQTKYSDNTIAMQELKSYAASIISDGEVDIQEITDLSDWISNHPDLAGYYPFDKISELCDSIFEDNIISDDEREQMLFLLKQFVNPMETGCCNCNIIFSEKIFVLSGDFTSGSKKEVEAKIAEKGGICKSGVTKKTDYLIVGGAGSDNWKFGNYGAKVSKALEMQENGHPIVILKESDLMQCFE